MVEFKGITKKYPNGTVALKNVSFKIQKGEFAFIIGSSGSGKTTIVRLILKEDIPTSGEISVNGGKLSHLHRRDVPYLRRGIGVVFQDFRLLPGKTVYENVAFAMQITGCVPREIRRQVPMALALVGLSRKSSHYPSQLSGGEQQRTVLARAIVNNPSLLIADEPTGNLDPDNSLEIMKLLSEINHRGTTVLVATHERSIVNMMKKRVLALDRGILVRDQEKGIYGDENKSVQIYY